MRKWEEPFKQVECLSSDSLWELGGLRIKPWGIFTSVGLTSRVAERRHYGTQLRDREPVVVSPKAEGQTEEQRTYFHIWDSQSYEDCLRKDAQRDCNSEEVWNPTLMATRVPFIFWLSFYSLTLAPTVVHQCLMERVRNKQFTWFKQLTMWCPAIVILLFSS
jgi:hypothetical protein